ncbi:hypothetical protein SCHPADRAFT_1000093 [Schizopora paradoxa]|uniref:Uncharacterized protein n=1 Tax=Schizopora paradoxa TaxID=27342 RepID=A0A0H2RD46_9AGAM|nr:hypothetical protein SCHPADRAFT_1000093 [Schizopora paradoxa]
MHYMRFPLENIDDVLVLQYEDERMLVSMNLSSKEERYGDMLRFVKEEWGLEKEEVIFQTDEHPLCNGQRVKMNQSLFIPHITSLIGTIYVSKKQKKQVEALAPVVESKLTEIGAATTKETTTNNISAISRLLELADQAIDHDDETDKASSDESTIMIDREDAESEASDSSEESAPYDTLADSTASMVRTEKSYITEESEEEGEMDNALADSTASIARSENSENMTNMEDSQTYGALADSTASMVISGKPSNMEDSQVSEALGESRATMLQSEATSEEEYSEAASTAPASPSYSELSLPKANDNRVLMIRVHKNVNSTPPIIFKVKLNQSLGSVFHRACNYFNFDPTMSAIFRNKSNAPLFKSMSDPMRLVCSRGGYDFIIYGYSIGETCRVVL